VFERMADGVLVVDPEGRVVDQNPAALRLLERRPRTPIAGRSWRR